MGNRQKIMKDLHRSSSSDPAPVLDRQRKEALLRLRLWCGATMLLGIGGLAICLPALIDAKKMVDGDLSSMESVTASIHGILPWACAVLAGGVIGLFFASRAAKRYRVLREIRQ